MQNASKLKGILASSFFFAVAAANANQQTPTSTQQPIFNGSYQTVIELNAQPLHTLNYNNLSSDTITNTKIISLMRLNPTAEMVQRAEAVAANVEMGLAAEGNYSEGVKPFKDSKTSKTLTMNDVPVLDQGAYGTCVTFATTAAMDAALNEGDLIDQQCSLAHNLFLGNNYWEGAYYASEIIDPLQTHGAVQKNKCTVKYPSPSLKIKTDVYKTLVNEDIKVKSVSYKYHDAITIDNVRQALDAGRRVAIGFQLKGNTDPITVQGFDVVVDGKKHKGGLWACKQPSSTKNYCGFAMAGHEVVVTGYDNDQKLLKIRNSWGGAAGEAGEFYMTYEFFDAMSINGTEIWL